MRTARLVALLLGTLCFATRAQAAEYVWIEAEHTVDVHGHFQSHSPDGALASQRGWRLAGPGVAPEWSQGGESEWNAIAAHPDEDAAVARYPFEVPATGQYAVWIRYADYQGKEELFAARVVQNGRAVYSAQHGKLPIVDEHDEVKLMWGWAYGWGRGGVTARLEQGPAVLELVAQKTQARRQIDAMLITDDLAYRPQLREKPPFAYFEPLARLARDRWKLAGETPRAARLTGARGAFGIPPSWRPRRWGGLSFRLLVNMPPDFWQQEQDGIPPAERVKYPFYVQRGTGVGALLPPTTPGAKPRPSRGKVMELFRRTYGGKTSVPIFQSPLVTPVLALGSLGLFLDDGKAFLDWAQKTRRHFALLLNYQLALPDSFGAPLGPRLLANLGKLRAQLLGQIAGESIAYVNPDLKRLVPAIKQARTRTEVLDAILREQSEGLLRKFDRAFAVPAGQTARVLATVGKAANLWRTIVSVPAIGMPGLMHAMAELGEETIGHEATANESSFAMRYAFLRGAARQLGRRFIWYQSSNFGDTATTFTSTGYRAGPETNFYHSHYDAFSGSGLVWYRKAYYAALMEGAQAVFLEQGEDQYFIPSPGEHSVQLSPFGRITEEILRFAERHPDRGAPYTPVAILLDRGHGYFYQEAMTGTLGRHVEENPRVLGFSTHDAMIRDLLRIVFHPLGIVEGEPVTSPGISFSNALLPHAADVLTTMRPSPERRPEAMLAGYRVIFLGGQIELDDEWGRALAARARAGAVVVVCEGQLSGAGAARLGLPSSPPAGATWRISRRLLDEKGGTHASNAFRFRTDLSAPAGGSVLFRADDRSPVAVRRPLGRGAVIHIGVPLGLGLDGSATPLLSQLFVDLSAGLFPVEVEGPIDSLIARTARGWAITLMNGRGAKKPQHGLGLPRRDEVARVRLSTRLTLRGAREWIEEQPLPVEQTQGVAAVTLEVPAGGIRIVHLDER